MIWIVNCICPKCWEQSVPVKLADNGELIAILNCEECDADNDGHEDVIIAEAQQRFAKGEHL